ncbi:MAG: NosR/NirI family nitrous oxide reductase transcriptional regulator [Pirellulaceae bacterium]|jgi:NosR/NirI family nitrous oxide reductase transcriptional regulator
MTDAPILPQIAAEKAEPRRSSRATRLLLMGFRLSLLVVIVWVIRDQHQWLSAQRRGQLQSSLSIADIHDFFPAATEFGNWDIVHGGRLVRGENNKPLGYIFMTSPTADEVIGYSGPTNLLIATDANHAIAGMKILTSEDTEDHVAMVVDDANFFSGFVGKPLSDIDANNIDAVSGATLTSKAIVETMFLRMHGTKPSLKFSEAVKLEEVERFFPTVKRLQVQSTSATTLNVFDSTDQKLGSIVRTGAASESLMGYQGPTDAIIALGPDDRVVGVAVHQSYDNKEYVDYVRDDDYFAKLFNGNTLGDLAAIDINEAQIEGVSGATMTSVTLAEGLIAAGREAASKTVATHEPRSLQIAARDISTIAIVLFACVLAFTRLRAKRWVRIVFQVLLIGYLGFVNGDLISQALLIGWAQNGVPWKNALGLTFLTGAAFVIPLIGRRQVYCHHICPHGAAQQLVRGLLPWRVRLPSWLSKSLKGVPPLLLAMIVIITMQGVAAEIAHFEPFDAYVIQAAGVATLTIAILGLVASMFVPMAYCRFACPTGAVLDYARQHGQSDRFGRRDYIAAGLVLLAITLRVLTTM